MSEIETILVCAKRVVDYNVRVHVRSDGSGVAIDGLKMSVNPFDEIALEEALRFRERGQAKEIVVVSIGEDAAQQQLRSALAMGADRAILVRAERALEPYAVARILLEIVRRERPGLVLMGKQAIDDDQNQTGQMLAALWDRPQATFASKLAIDAGVATVTRETDGGLETIEIDLPGVVTADLRLNEPRYAKLPEILKAKRKPLETLELDAFTLPSDSLRVIETRPPEPRAAGRIVASVDDLLAALEERGAL